MLELLVGARGFEPPAPSSRILGAGNSAIFAKLNQHLATPALRPQCSYGVDLAVEWGWNGVQFGSEMAVLPSGSKLIWQRRMMPRLPMSGELIADSPTTAIAQREWLDFSIRIAADRTRRGILAPGRRPGYRKLIECIRYRPRRCGYRGLCLAERVSRKIHLSRDEARDGAFECTKQF